MHTKGKWEAYFGHDNQFAGEPLITAPRENGLPHVMVARLIDGTLPELEANAHLISAAPEMYEALKMYQNFIRNTRSMGRTYSEVEILQAQTKIAQKLNEALAKAEGVN